MPNINDRIGSQNVIRVLSNASAPPTRLVNLSDVDSTLKTRDGMILVWDLATESFYMTDTIDSSTLVITGIATFSNTTNSTAPTDGALIVSGGLGVAKHVNIGEGFTVAGVSTFSSDLDINAAVDILNGVTANSTFKSVGVTTLASAGGITTTGGDLYVGADLYISDDLVLDEFTARNGNITGIATVGTTLDVNGTLDVDGRTELDITNIAETLNVTGISTFGNTVDINADLDVDGRTELDITNIAETLNVVGISTFASDVDINGSVDIDGHTELDNLNVSGVSTFASAVDVNSTATFGDNVTFETNSGNNILFNRGSNFLKFGDNTDARFGSAGDLKIYHNGTNSYIDNNTGPLYIRNNVDDDDGSNIIIEAKSGKASAVFQDDEGVRLYFDNAQKFETTANGINVTGHVETDTLNVSGLSTFVGNASFAGNVSIAGTLTYEDVTNVDSIGFITARSGIHIGSPSIGSTLTSGGDLLMSRNLRVAGVSTFVGVGTFQNDLYVGGDLYVADDISIDELNVRDANITGIATVATLLDVTGHAELDTLNVSGVSTFIGIATFSNNVFVVGTLDAGLIDGGEF